jgi:rRNA-processing protein FCF1
VENLKIVPVSVCRNKKLIFNARHQVGTSDMSLSKQTTRRGTGTTYLRQNSKVCFISFYYIIYNICACLQSAASPSLFC